MGGGGGEGTNVSCQLTPSRPSCYDSQIHLWNLYHRNTQKLKFAKIYTSKTCDNSEKTLPKSVIIRLHNWALNSDTLQL